MSDSDLAGTVRRRGARKTPGGKLVIVDFLLERGQLRDVVLSGDFFLYPEEAIEPLTAALEGMPVDLPPAGIAARVAAAIPPGAELLGFSPAAIAEAVRRALTPETDDD
jgi:lipoate---protein ligase